MLGKDGRVVITDFGIAAASDREKTLGGVVGTPAYMAPEQVEGGDIDGRTDLFALGVLLYQMTTRNLPWKDPQPFANAMARLLRPAPDPRTYNPNLPEPLVRLLTRALARRPDERPGSAADFAAALAAIDLRASTPTSDRPTSLPGTADFAMAAAHSLQSNLPPAVVQLSTAPGITPAAHPVSVAQPTKTLAVLPIRNLGSSEDAYLAEGFTEELIDTLSMTSGLRVRPRGAVAALREKDLDPRDAGQRLGVQLIVEGTLRRMGNGVRISVRLSSVADGFQIWARRFERPASDLMQVSDEAVCAIAEALTVTPAESLGPGTSDPQALDLYLRARYEYNHGEDVALERAISLYQQAVDRAPDDPALLAGYALACSRGWFFGIPGTGERSAELAERLMRLSPHRGEPYVVQAALCFQQGDLAGADLGLRKALSLAPGLSETHALLGRILLETGPVEDGLRALRHALALDPTLEGRLFVEMARAYAMLGQWEQVDNILNSHAPSRRVWILRARLCSWLKDKDRALKMMQSQDLQSGRYPEVMMLLRLIRGEESEADRQSYGGFFQRLAGSVRTRIFSYQIRTEMAGANERTANAEEMLAQAVSVGLFDLMWLERCPLLAPLRSLPSYPALHALVRERATKMTITVPAHQ